MMNARDLTRKMLAGCGHTQAIVVPHDECVAAQLAQWEAAIRLDCARTLAKEHRQAIDDNNAAVEKARQEVEKMNKKVTTLGLAVIGLEEHNSQLRDRLRAAMTEIDSLRVSLQAETAQKLYAKYPSVVSE